MPIRLPDTVRAEIVRLRLEEALSLSGIAERLELAKSTVQYVVEGIRVTPAAAKKLRRMRQLAQRENAARLGRAAPHHSRVYFMDEEHRRAAASRARETSLKYLQNELPIRSKLMARYGTTLLKEAFEGVVLKACGAGVVIDWAMTKAAAYGLPRRMAVVKSLLDKRKRVVFIPRQYLRSKTAERLRKLRVEVLAVEELLD